MKKTIIILSIFFVFLSFFPTLFEIYSHKNLPKDRAAELVHNYVFDYNFYLSRIREGQPAFVPVGLGLRRSEGRWLVTEKYYNRPHPASFFQIFYLLIGKAGGLLGLGPPVIYHGARLILGFVLLLMIGKLVMGIFPAKWNVIAFLLVVTAGSWPIPVKSGDAFRFSTYWGGWSVIDSLQRITFIPHVLVGQIFLLLFIMAFTSKSLKSPESLKWGVIGLVAGIIFPPVLITIYTIFAVLSAIEVITHKLPKSFKSLRENVWIKEKVIPRIVFTFISFPALLYLQLMMKIQPWQALSVFDIQHRSILPYVEYVKALGPMLPLGIAGGLVVLGRLRGVGSLGRGAGREERLIPIVSWIAAIFLLFGIFERVPQQSPTRFTQMLINVPLGILATYFFYSIWKFYDKYRRSHAFVIRIGSGSVIAVIVFIILMGFSVMVSMVGWKTDEVKGKQAGTWAYPVGVQLVYPLKDFMAGVDYLRLNTKISDVVLAYEAAGNYIPAYGGNYVYLGHANTPNEDGKLGIAARFFKAEMSRDEAKEFLQKENIKYIYYGPQEKEIGGIDDLVSKYSFLTPVYTNNRVTIFKFTK